MSRGNYLCKVIIVAIFIGCVFAGCDKKDENQPEIKVENPTALTQTLFADEKMGMSVVFTTIGSWTSSVTPSEALWISISPNGGNEAETYTIDINLWTNFSGEDRSAEIAIICEGKEIDINVTQKALTKEGEIPQLPVMLLTWGEPNLYAGSANIGLRGTGEVFVDWGDGSDLETETFRFGRWVEFRHYFSSRPSNPIKVLGDVTHFECILSGIGALDLSGNTGLVFLNCETNQGLRNLDVSKNVALTTIIINDCGFSAIALDDLFGTLPDNAGSGETKTIFIRGNPGTNNCNRSIASDKGWTVSTDRWTGQW